MKRVTVNRIKEGIKNKKNILIVAVGVLGVLLLLLPELSDGAQRTKSAERDDSDGSRLRQELQSELGELVSSVDGAGNCRVLLTLDSSEEAAFATDTNIESVQDERTTEYAREESYVLIDGETGLRLKTLAPEVRGVAVVCEGGGDSRVKREVTELLSAALGIGREKIYVAKMTQKNGGRK